MAIENYITEAKIIKAKNDLLREIIKHCHYCQHCKHYFKDESICCLAYACLTQDFYYHNDEEEDEK